MTLRHRDRPDDGLTDDDRARLAALDALGRDERLDAYLAPRARAHHGPEQDRAKKPDRKKNQRGRRP